MKKTKKLKRWYTATIENKYDPDPESTYTMRFQAHNFQEAADRLIRLPWWKRWLDVTQGRVVGAATRRRK